MAPKKASSDPPVPRRTMPRREAAPGNLNVTYLQRSQEAAARAAAARPTRPTQKRSRAVAKKPETLKSKKPVSNWKRGRPVSKKLGSKKGATNEKEKKTPALNKVKNGRVAKPASSVADTSGGRKAGLQSPPSGSSELSSSVSDLSSIEVAVSPKKATSKAGLKKVKNGRVTKPASSGRKTRQQFSVSGSSRMSTPVSDLSSVEDVLPPRQSTPEVMPSGPPSEPLQGTPTSTPQRTPIRTPQGPPQLPSGPLQVTLTLSGPSQGTRTRTPQGPPQPPSERLQAIPSRAPEGPASGMPSGTITRGPTTPPNELPRGINGTPSTLSRTPGPTTPVSSPREILSAVPRRMGGRTPRGPPNRLPRRMLTGTPSTLSRTPRAWESSSQSPVSAVSKPPEQNRLPTVNEMSEGERYNPNDPDVEYVEVWGSEADIWELRTVRRA